MISSNPSLDSKSNLGSQSNILKAQQLLEKNQVAIAGDIIAQAKRIFKEQEQYVKVLEC
jgi:hypothetical protein